MKYDFFKDFNRKHTLDFFNLYSELFKNIKFVRKTYYLVNETFDKDGKSTGYICVDIKDPNSDRIIKLYISLFKFYPTSYHVHDIFFKYNDEYFAITNIRYIKDGISYVCESYSEESIKFASESKVTNLPRPDDFKQLNIEPGNKVEEIIRKDFKNNIINYITKKYHVEKKEVTSKFKPRVRF